MMQAPNQDILSKEHYQNIPDLYKSLSKSLANDNVLDLPYGYALRRDLDSPTLPKKFEEKVISMLKYGKSLIKHKAIGLSVGLELTKGIDYDLSIF